MVQSINGRLIFTYGGPKKEYNKPIRLNLKLFLLGALKGIFLLPNLAYLSAITPEKLIELTNKERQAAGLNSLTTNQLLTQAAAIKAQTILATNAFGHTINDRKFSAWIRDTGYDYAYVGENQPDLGRGKAHLVCRVDCKRGIQPAYHECGHERA